MQRPVDLNHLLYFVGDVLLYSNQGVLESIEVLEDLSICNELFVEVQFAPDVASILLQQSLYLELFDLPEDGKDYAGLRVLFVVLGDIQA